VIISSVSKRLYSDCGVCVIRLRQFIQARVVALRGNMQRCAVGSV
jgi:bacterioferritin-associated ferredoxin